MTVKVLLVDDKTENLFALEKMLQSDNRVFLKATSTSNALKLAINNELALILLDVQMPEMDGFELAKILKSNSKTSNIPIIFVTAINKDEKYVLKGYDLGAVDYLFKPLNLAITRAKVDTFINLYQQNRELENKNILLENLTRLVDNSLNITCIFKKSDLIIQEVNTTFLSLLGYASEEIIERSLLQFLVFENTLHGAQLFQEEISLKKDVVEFENQIKCADGSIKWLTWRIATKGDFCFANASDVTLRKFAEKKLEENFTNLIKVNNELAEAKKIAEDSVKIKQDFMANMSHEIRTPMNAIIGFTQLLLKTNLNEEQQKYLRSIKISGENLIVIINDILDFSKIEAGKLNIESVDFNLAQLFSDIKVIEENAVLAKGLSLHFDLDKTVPNWINADPVRINQILLNLLTNAVKFTHQGGITVKVSSEQKNKQAYLKILCKDTGIGISKEKQQFIFESFTQENGDTTRKYGGTGLGLTIVKKLLELMGGEISLHSEVGKGSEFLVLIPYGFVEDKTTDEEDLDNGFVEEELKGKRILLAEDNMMNQILAKKVLSDVGIVTDIAENGLEAVEFVQKNAYDLILMDIMMPEMDGLEATKEIRKTFSAKQLPILAMTAFVFTGGDDKKIYEAGMDDFILKPFNPNSLYSKIYSLINRV
jgi:PAS domain S-box-containing protein